MRTHSITPIYFFILLFLIVSGCTRERILYADFESDRPGSLPDLDLPGGPVGDGIRWSGPNGLSNPRLQVRVRDTSQVLNYFHSSGAANELPATVEFHPSASDEDIYSVTWRGTLLLPPVPAELLVRVTAGREHGAREIVRLAMRLEVSGGVRRLAVYDSKTDSEERIGYLTPSVQHTLTVLINRTNDRYAVAGAGITHGGDINATVPHLPPSLRFSAINFPGGMEYEIEDVVIDAGQ